MSAPAPADARELLRRYCEERDEAAFDAFFRAEAPRLWRFLRARGAGEADAYDLVAEAFLRFTASVCRDPRAPVALLYRIALNAHIDAHRRAAVREAIGSLAAIEVRTEGPEEHVHLRRVVAGMPPDEQNLLLLRFWIGLTHREIAGVLGWPEGTVRRRVAEAVQVLRARWTQ